MASFQIGNLPEGGVLTFYDALKCHFKDVYPILKKRNLWGIFYIPTQPYVENKFLDVHRIHILLGKFESKIVYDYLQQIISENHFDHTKKDDFERLTYSTQINDNYTLLVKRILNYFISYDFREEILDQLIAHFIPNHQDIFHSYYMTTEEIKTMHDGGMIIGSHTINHPVMARLSLQKQEYQIVKSFEFLEKIKASLPSLRTFCYPYGGFHSFTDETEKLLTDNQCVFSFNVEQRDINADDIAKRPQALPRYDCNQFKYGQVRNKYADTRTHTSKRRFKRNTS